MEFQATYAVAMHLHANRKTGVFGLWALVAGGVAALFLDSLWPVAAAVTAIVAAWFFIMKSCVRFIERQIGMPPEIQHAFSAQYKKDQEFAKKVDALFHATKPKDA
jgi:hypothetical protein